MSPSIQKIDDWLDAHIDRSIKTMESNEVDLWKDSEIDMMRDLIYPNMEEYRLLLTKAQGSPYEGLFRPRATYGNAGKLVPTMKPID